MMIMLKYIYANNFILKVFDHIIVNDNLAC